MDFLILVLLTLILFDYYFNFLENKSKVRDFRQSLAKFDDKLIVVIYSAQAGAFV